MNHAEDCLKYLGNLRCSCGFDRTPFGLVRQIGKAVGGFVAFVIVAVVLLWSVPDA